MPPNSSDSTQRFSTRVRFYVRSRPRYPSNLIPFLNSALGLLPAHIIADIGSGTGFLSEPFLSNRNHVFGVEPNAPMRKAAESLLGEFQNFHSINGTAEATTLPGKSIDFITAGQAFHWFEPNATRVEFKRILRLPSNGTGGIVILIWNDRRLDDAIAVDYQHLIDRHSIDHAAVKARDTAAHEPAVLRSFFGSSGYQHQALENQQLLDEEGFLNRIISASYMPTPDHPSYSAMEVETRQLFAARQQNGQVCLRYDTNIYYGRLA
jgi:hypothetical protein